MTDAPISAPSRLSTLLPDFRAGLAVALVSIPEGMAYALVAGVNPIYGLYTGMVTTVVAATTGSTSRQIVTLTNALALVAGETLVGLSGVDPLAALFTLTLTVGILMAVLGALNLGSVIRFVSKEVMAGFVFVTALLIVLGQLKDLVGYSSALEAGKLLKAIDIMAHIGEWSVPATLVGLASMAVLIAAKRSRLASLADVLVIVFATVVVWLIGSEAIEIVADIATVPSGLEALPRPVLPDLTLVPLVLAGAAAATVVGLAESSGVGAAFPNTDGKRSNMSRDFLSQGLGNIAGAFFQAMPAGGSLSRTGINASGGAVTRASGMFAGICLALVLVIAGGLANLIPLTGLAALLTVIGVEIMLKEGKKLVAAWHISRAGTVVAVLTILIGLTVDLTAAILGGVLLSLLLHAVQSSMEVSLVELRPDEAGRWTEAPMEPAFQPGEVRVVELRGSPSFASVYDLDGLMPDPTTLAGVTLIWRVRDRSIASLTGLEWLEGYAEAVTAAGGRLVLTGTSARTAGTFKSAPSLLDRIRTFPATPVLFESTQAALDWARQGDRD